MFRFHPAPFVRTGLVAALLAVPAWSAQAHGLATCDSGPQDKWQPKEKLERQLTDKGWKIRRVKVDGGCYEVYAVTAKGDRIEAYFHPLTLEQVAAKTE
jgi:hypothetical protein